MIAAEIHEQMGDAGFPQRFEQGGAGGVNSRYFTLAVKGRGFGP
jgi:hypothetical protein